MAEEQRDLISDRGSGVLSVGDTQRSALRRKAAFSTLSILVALLIAGQAVTVYFVYQQSGQISKLTKTSQNLQLEALQRKLPASAKIPKMKMAIANSPLVMRVPHPALFEDLPVRDPPLLGTACYPLDFLPCSHCPFAFSLDVKVPASNKTEDQVKHLLLQADPRKMFPDLKDSLLDNLKRLRSTMPHSDWKSFESWLDKWLLFQMAKNPKSEEPKAIPAEKGTDAPTAASTPADAEEMIFSGVDVLKMSASK
ncbi:HG2A protein, partial [Dasyornis broadbenti]|nr:HG2A protein [Dasyornis broadbenti]